MDILYTSNNIHVIKTCYNLTGAQKSLIYNYMNWFIHTMAIMAEYAQQPVATDFQTRHWSVCQLYLTRKRYFNCSLTIYAQLLMTT